MKKILLPILFGVVSMLLMFGVFPAGKTSAQVSAPQILYITSNPTGNACGATNIALRTPNGLLYTCQSGTYALAFSGAGTGCTTAGANGEILVDNGKGGCTSTAPTISGTTVTADLTGNASTATALAANPADCTANRYATTIAANGDLTCAQVNLASGVTGTLGVGNGGTGITSFGTGVATALGQNVSGTGSICLSSGSACSGGGGSSYGTFFEQTAGIPMTGSNVAIYTATAAPALASGRCYHIRFGALTIANNNVFIFAGNTQIIQVWVNANNAFIYSEVLYCNNNGTQMAQSVDWLSNYFITAASLPANGAQTQTAITLPQTPTAVDWTTSHDISIQFNGNALSNTVTGAFFQVTLQ